MSNLQYEFLTHEIFPDDQYVKEVVEVLISGAIILPYQHVKMKDGGSFWTFCGCSPAKSDGTKKRFVAAFDSRTAKIKFENDLEAFIKAKASRSIDPYQTPQQNAPAVQETSKFGTMNDQIKLPGEVIDQNLPF